MCDQCVLTTTDEKNFKRFHANGVPLTTEQVAVLRENTLALRRYQKHGHPMPTFKPLTLPGETHEPAHVGP